MAERVTIGVGAQHTSGPVLITVQGTGADSVGPFATVSLGEHPDVTYARLRVGEPQAMPDGPTLRLAGIAPEGYAPAIALEISR
jgi:hypothetical protein